MKIEGYNGIIFNIIYYYTYSYIFNTMSIMLQVKTCISLNPVYCGRVSSTMLRPILWT